MKITSKINFLITVWLLFILLIVCTIVYFLFMKTTVNMEEQVVFQKMHEILDKQYISDSMMLDKEPLHSYMPSHSFIRIVDPNFTYHFSSK